MEKSSILKVLEDAIKVASKKQQVIAEKHGLRYMSMFDSDKLSAIPEYKQLSQLKDDLRVKAEELSLLLDSCNKIIENIHNVEPFQK